MADPGDTLTSAEVTMTSEPCGGTVYFDQMINFTASGCAINQFSCNISAETGSFQGPTLANGTYWLQLSNASVPSGDPVYWDENSGVGCTSPDCPSQARTIEPIPPESFALYGNPAGRYRNPAASCCSALASSASLGFCGGCQHGNSKPFEIPNS